MRWAVVRTKPIGRTHGIAVPVFFDNFAHNYTTVSVYSDGLIDCWFFAGCIDLGLVRREVEEGRIVTQAPTGALIDVPDLGWATVGRCDWQCTPADFLKQVEESIETLNRSAKGLVDLNGERVEILDGIRYSKFCLANGQCLLPLGRKSISHAGLSMGTDRAESDLAQLCRRWTR